MNQSELEKQTEALAEMLERDVVDIRRNEIVDSYQMALKRLRNLLEVVDNRDAPDRSVGNWNSANDSDMLFEDED